MTDKLQQQKKSFYHILRIFCTRFHLDQDNLVSTVNNQLFFTSLKIRYQIIQLTRITTLIHLDFWIFLVVEHSLEFLHYVLILMLIQDIFVRRFDLSYLQLEHYLLQSKIKKKYRNNKSYFILQLRYLLSHFSLING